MTTGIDTEQLAVAGAADRPALIAMLEARSVAVVGASRRDGSFGARMLAEVARSAARPAIYPVNPRYDQVGGLRCYPSLADLPEAADLVLLGVPDAVVEEQLALAASQGGRSAVIFGNAHEEPDREPAGTARPGLRQRLAATARTAGMELCGAGCMGFANPGYGLRAMGYVEPDPLPAGPVALVTHSGSVFSALLRTRRAFGFTLAVSSGQELVTTAPSYLDYALDLAETRVLALVMEAIRQPERLRAVLDRAASRDVPVVLLTAGHTAGGQAMVAAHSGALAGSDGGWEALTRTYGLHRVEDLAELADTLELFSLRSRGPGRPGRPSAGRPGGSGHGIATVHDSGLERAHAADVAGQLGVPFAQISDATKARLASRLDPGLIPANPLDVWGTGSDTRELFGQCLMILAGDDRVEAVALAVDLITELDGDTAYQLAVLDAAASTDKPVVVLANIPGGVDYDTAALLRGRGVPVLDSMRTGMVALRHLLARQARGPRTAPPVPPPDPARLTRARALLEQAGDTGAAQLALLAEYGIGVARTERAAGPGQVLDAAARIGYPVVLKTDEPGIAHKSDVGGVRLGLTGPGELAAAYADLAARLGPAVLVCQSVPAGTELALGLVRDPALGPLLVVGAGGILVELIADRAVALPPLTAGEAAGLIGELRVARLLAGTRGGTPADLDAVTRAITGLADLACELGEHLDALDINPLICGPHGAIAADALVIPR
ncbi:MAG: acetate--CoA ligase family protein [Streptosporangiaceae bacterium]